MPQQIHQHTFTNGLTLLFERMDHVRSAAVNFLVPAGCAYDPPDRLGLVSILSDLITRGAGDRDSRALTLALDSLGLDHSESAGQLHLRFWGSTLARNLTASLELFADILRRPHLPADELDSVKALALQDLQGLEDDPSSKAMVELRRRFWPMPLGQDRRGTEASIQALTIDDLRAFHQKRFTPRAIIVSVAGNLDWEPLRDQVGSLFEDWTGEVPHPPELQTPIGGTAHLEKDTTQTQIAIAYPSVVFGHPEYYAAMGAVRVLSGGMGARLFTEVREKRGLCYSVSAGHQTFKQAAGVLCYAGTTTERAQETLDVTVAELRRLAEGITEEEVQRVRAGLKSSVIMQEESTSSRAGALASDWYYLGRVRSTEEVQRAIDGLTPDSILAHVRSHPVENLTIVTLGKEALRMPGESQASEPEAAPTSEAGSVEFTAIETVTPLVTEVGLLPPMTPAVADHVPPGVVLDSMMSSIVVDSALPTIEVDSPPEPPEPNGVMEEEPEFFEPELFEPDPPEPEPTPPPAEVPARRPAKPRPAKSKPGRAASKPVTANVAKANVAKAKPAKAKPAKAVKAAKAKPATVQPVKSKAVKPSVAKAKASPVKAATKAKPGKAKPGKAEPGKAKPANAKPVKVKAVAKKTAKKPIKTQVAGGKKAPKAAPGKTKVGKPKVKLAARKKSKAK